MIKCTKLILIVIIGISMILSGEYLYSLAAFFSLSAYLLGNILWLRVFLIIAALFYIFSGIMLGLTSMIGWNSAYFVINLFHVVILLLDKNSIVLPQETRQIYNQIFSTMSTREFRKIILTNEFYTVEGELIIAQGDITDRLFIILAGTVSIVHSGKKIATLREGDLVGEMSFISKEPASASAIATESVQYAFWTHEDLEKLKQKNCGIYNKFISIIGRDLVKKLNKKNEEIR